MKIIFILSLTLLVVNCSHKDKGPKQEGNFIGFIPNKTQYGELKRIPVKATQRLADAYMGYSQRTAITDLLLSSGFEGDAAVRIDVQEIVNQKVIASYLKLKVESNFSVEKAKNYYENHLNQFVSKEFKLAHILLKSPKKQGSNEVEARANELVNQLKGGADFDALCKEFSDDTTTKKVGGLITDIPYANLDVSVKNAIQNLNAGEISNVVRTSRGYEIFKVVSVNQTQQAFEEVKARVEFETKSKIEADELALLVSKLP